MAIQVGAKPDSTFDDPLGLLGDCHRRVERFLEAFRTVEASRKGGELDEEARNALEASLRYFRNAAPRHTRDEEDSLFPRMRATRNEAALVAIDALERDHQRAEVWHATVDELVERWLASGSLSPEDARCLHESLEHLHGLYAHHIAAEDSLVFPLAARILDGAALTQIGREMAERRGIDPDAPPSGPRCRHAKMLAGD